MELAPIILIVYNRPWHTEQTLNALKSNELADQSILYIFCDGPKPDGSAELLKEITEVRTIIRKKKWCKEVIIKERTDNVGLANNVTEGISEIIAKHGKIIVLEDDLITAPYFLSYCNDGLNTYKDATNVYAINGYQFPLETDEVTTFLSPQATSSWGWATWKDRWLVYDAESVDHQLIQKHKQLRSRFDIADNKKSVILGNKNSWAIVWYYSVFLRNGLGLFPTKSLVQNIGFDNSGVHCGEIAYSQHLHLKKISIQKQEKIDLHFYGLVLDWFTLKHSEPNKTLDGGAKGSSFLKKIIKKIKAFGRSNQK